MMTVAEKAKVGQALAVAARKLPKGDMTDKGINGLVGNTSAARAVAHLGVAVSDVVWSWLDDGTELGAESMVPGGPSFDLASMCRGSSRRQREDVMLGIHRCGWARKEGATEDLVDDLRLTWIMMRHLTKMISGKSMEEMGDDWGAAPMVMPGTGTVQELWSKLSKQFRNAGKTKDNMNRLLEVMKKTGAITGPLGNATRSAEWHAEVTTLGDAMLKMMRGAWQGEGLEPTGEGVGREGKEGEKAPGGIRGGGEQGAQEGMEMPEGTGTEAGSGEAGLQGGRETVVEEPIDMEEEVVVETEVEEKEEEVEVEEVEERETPTVRLATEGEGSEMGCPSEGAASGGEGTAAGLGGQGLENGGQDAEGEERSGARGPEGGLEGGPVTRKGKSRRRQPNWVDEVLGELFDMEEVVVEAEEVKERGTPTVRLATEGEGSETGRFSKGEDTGGEGTAAGLGGQGLEDGGQDAEGEVRTGAQGLEGGLEGGPVTRKGKSRRRQPKVADVTGGREEPMGKGEETAGGGASTGGLEGGSVTRKGRSRGR